MINPKQVDIKTVNVNAKASYETEKQEKQNYATIALKCLLRETKVT